MYKTIIFPDPNENAYTYYIWTNTYKVPKTTTNKIKDKYFY